MEPFDEKYLPHHFGLINTGVICYANGLLQALVSNTSIVKKISENEEYFSRTSTGSALYNFIKAIINKDDGVEIHSRLIVRALINDLRSRKTSKIEFGNSQESASEFLMFLLEMSEVSTDEPSPLNELLFHRYECKIFCKECKKMVSKKEDNEIAVKMFYLDALKKIPEDSIEFTNALHSHTEELEEYTCPICQKQTKCLRTYTLTMCPEVIICQFNVYKSKREKYTPDELNFLNITKTGYLNYKLVAVVEHTGGLSGGHYYSKCQRSDGPYVLNDLVTFPAELSPSKCAYLMFYNYTKTI
jgi:ubiquitin C-terminal hydrolase